jgi:hypothetical protein
MPGDALAWLFDWLRVNRDDYTFAQLAWNGIGCAAWLVAYAALLYNIRRRRFVEMPALVAGANIGWEYVWSFRFKPDTGALFLAMYRGAFFLDLFIFCLLLEHGARQPMPAAMRRHFRPVAFANAVLWGALCYFFTAEGYDTRIGANSGYVINVFLSASYLLNVLRGEDPTLYSPVIAWSKMLGTGAITVSLFLIYDGHEFVKLLGVICAVLDVTCIAALRSRRAAVA